MRGSEGAVFSTKKSNYNILSPNKPHPLPNSLVYYPITGSLTETRTRPMAAKSSWNWTFNFSLQNGSEYERLSGEQRLSTSHTPVMHVQNNIQISPHTITSDISSESSRLPQFHRRRNFAQVLAPTTALKLDSRCHGRCVFEYDKSLRCAVFTVFTWNLSRFRIFNETQNQ
jgi:hypothetical protein